MMQSVLNKTNYTNKSIAFLNKEIVEYDMKSAGFNLIRQHKLVPDDIIVRLSAMEKHERHIAIGNLKYNKRVKNLTENLNELFTEYRLKFGEANELTDTDIISVKKDAIFTTKFCPVTKFDMIEFDSKNVYNSYMLINKTKIPKDNDIELYWNENGIDVKGIDDENLIRHRDYMLKFLWIFIRRLMSDEQSAAEYLGKFINDYKYCKLDPNYYRSLNANPVFRIFKYDRILEVDDIGADDLRLCDISFNYNKFIIPLIKLVL